MKIYLAGPDVFLGNADEKGKELKAKCAALGVEGLYPLDAEATTAVEIVKKDIDMIRSADCVIANCNDFRGFDMDSGTAFEIGYAVATGKPVFCYCDDLRAQVEKYGDKCGPYLTENFGKPLNIMITETTKVFGSFDEALFAAVTAQKESS